MPTQNEDNEKISLVVAGKSHGDWTSYRIDSDFLKPADGWQLSLGLPDKAFPTEVVRGAVVRLQVGGETVLSGRIDSVRRLVSRGNYSLTLTGRDDAAILVDCAAPVFSANQLTLDEVIEKIVRPLGIKNIRVQADSAPRNDKVTIEPGCRAWDALAKAAAGRGLWPWFDPDGTLVVGGPDYSAEPVATLVLKNDGAGNNVLELEDSRSINGCFSELTALAQCHAKSADSKSDTASLPVDIWNDDGSVKLLASSSGSGDGQTGTNDMKAMATDPTVDYYRPQIITIGDTNNMEQVNYRAKKEMSDARLTGLDISAQVKGHRTSGGVLWEPGQRVRITSEPHGFDAIFFLMGRQFSGGRSNGQTTSLRFKEDGVWIPDAFPREKKRRHRRGKKNKNDVAIVDV
ncbi:phage tail protein [Serratia marcescens]|nr:phage tail protein [Serratia marcescens]